MVLVFVLVVSRLKNIGMNPLWSLLILVPLGNIWISGKCLVAQEGFNDTKKLDGPGRIISSILLGLIIWLLLWVITDYVAYHW